MRTFSSDCSSLSNPLPPPSVMKAKQMGHSRLKTARRGHGKGGAACPLRVLDLLERWHRGLRNLFKNEGEHQGSAWEHVCCSLWTSREKEGTGLGKKLTLFNVTTAKFRVEQIFGSQILPKCISSNSLCCQGLLSPRFSGRKMPGIVFPPYPAHFIL